MVRECCSVAVRKLARPLNLGSLLPRVQRAECANFRDRLREVFAMLFRGRYSWQRVSGA
jgi:hypothetical protein